MSFQDGTTGVSSFSSGSAGAATLSSSKSSASKKKGHLFESERPSFTSTTLGHFSTDRHSLGIGWSTGMVADNCLRSSAGNGAAVGKSAWSGTASASHSDCRSTVPARRTLQTGRSGSNTDVTVGIRDAAGEHHTPLGLRIQGCLLFSFLFNLRFSALQPSGFLFGNHLIEGSDFIPENGRGLEIERLDGGLHLSNLLREELLRISD